METALGVTLGLGGKATPGVVDTAGGIQATTSSVLTGVLAARLATGAGLTGILARGALTASLA